MDCVRAVEFFLRRPEIDTSRVGVMGGNQGGGFTLVTAGLCNDKIKVCAYFDPFPGDTRDQYWSFSTKFCSQISIDM